MFVGLFSSYLGWPGISGKERFKGPEGRAGSSRPGPALSCGMSQSYTLLITTYTAFLPPSLSLIMSVIFLAFLWVFPCECLTDSCWQGCDQAKGLSVEAGISSPPPPLLPSGPEAPCPVVQYLYVLSQLFSIQTPLFLFHFSQILVCADIHQVTLCAGLVHDPP